MIQDALAEAFDLVELFGTLDGGRSTKKFVDGLVDRDRKFLEQRVVDEFSEALEGNLK